MEADNHDNTTAGGGGESETKSLRPNVKGYLKIIFIKYFIN